MAIFLKKKWKFWQFFLKKCQVFGNSNGNFPEGQMWIANLVYFGYINLTLLFDSPVGSAITALVIWGTKVRNLLFYTQQNIRAITTGTLGYSFVIYSVGTFVAATGGMFIFISGHWGKSCVLDIKETLAASPRRCRVTVASRLLAAIGAKLVGPHSGLQVIKCRVFVAL